MPLMILKGSFPQQVNEEMAGKPGSWGPAEKQLVNGGGITEPHSWVMPVACNYQMNLVDTEFFDNRLWILLKDGNWLELKMFYQT